METRNTRGNAEYRAFATYLCREKLSLIGRRERIAVKAQYRAGIEPGRSWRGAGRL